MKTFESFLGTALQHIEQIFEVRETDHRLTKEESLLFRRAWTVLVPIDVGSYVEDIEVRILFHRDFPLSLPVIFVEPELVRRLHYPLHVSVEGLVCTHDKVTTQTNISAPGEIVEDVIGRARKIITNGFRTVGSTRDYSDEYLAYWNQRFDHEPELIDDCLSLLGTDEIGEAQIFWGQLTPKFGKYTSLLYREGQQDDKLFRELKSRGITVGKESVWYAGEIEPLLPPFRLSNRAAIEMVEQASSDQQIHSFRRYLNRCRRPIVFFRTTISERPFYLGWAFHLPHKTRGTKKLSFYHRLMEAYGKDAVTRISPDDATVSRLVGRTTGQSGEPDQSRINIMIAGLGSVGSHFAPYVSSLPGAILHLVDPDILQIENIGRHLLGLSDTGENKAHAVARHLQRTSALSELGSVHSQGIVELALKNSDLLSSLDYLFVCIGEANTEIWLDQARREGRGPKKGIFYFWVEPLLAGGHCLFLPSHSDVTLEECFDDNEYKFNVISPETYRTKTFTLREHGCQTTFTPYAGSSVQLFIGGIIARVMSVLKCDQQTAVAMVWIGDARNARAEGCSLSPSALNRSMGELLVYPLTQEAMV